jgi:putative hemolysin
MELIVIGILILLNGFFALSEIALVSSKKSRLEQMKIEGKKGAKSSLKLLEKSENFLSAVQVGITLIGIVTGVYGGLNIAEDITPFFQNIEFLRSSADDIALVVTIVTITYFSIVFGELVPKTIALSNPEKIAVKIAPIIFYFSKLFYPFVKLLSISTSLFNKFIGIEKKSEHLTESELRQMIKIASHEGVIEKEQNLIHEKVFYFADKKAKHIMTPRVDVEWVDLKESEESVRSAILGSKHNKIICSNDDLDNFVGILVIKDFLLKSNTGKSFNVSDLVVSPIIVPENAEAHNVLKLFRHEQSYFSIVVNEYGSFEGIITLHDIMENLIGEMPEEGETEEPDIFVRSDKSVLVSGDAPVEILDGIIEGFVADFGTINYSTVAGFVFDRIRKIPQVGDKFEYAGYTVEIVDIDGNRIDKILISKIKDSQ